jgi:SAM-dependent methyltransferase
MRKHLRRFVELASRTLELQDPVYEFGALQVHGDRELEDLRPLFPGREYVGTDMRAGPGVDKVLNLHGLDLPNNSVGTAICMDTLEHVEYPRKAIEELLRVLNSNGVLIISSVMNFPIHGYPNDYWRFTPQGFKSLLVGFNESFVGFDGPADFPHTIVGVGFKGTKTNLRSFNLEFEQWQKRNNRNIEHIGKYGALNT